jgi:hypothetical protein
MPGTERWQHFPVVSGDEKTQARRDAAELHHTIGCTARCYGIAPDRMGRALEVLAREWLAWVAKGRP